MAGRSLPCRSPQLTTKQISDEFLWQQRQIPIPATMAAIDKRTIPCTPINADLKATVDMLRSRKVPAGTKGPMQKVKAGLFIQSLKFLNFNEINIIGYIWQRYQRGLQNHIKPAGDKFAFVLPEQVNSSSDIKPSLALRVCTATEETLGWYFEATLRQPFDYSEDAFNYQIVLLRMWHHAFSGNIILVPDFDAYSNKTSLTIIFGIDNTIVLANWDRDKTYFDYELSSYDTNFGIPGYIGQKGFPELRYNLVLLNNPRHK